MIPRLSAFALPALLGLSIAVPTAAQPSEVDEAVILATNSVQLGQKVELVVGLAITTVDTCVEVGREGGVGDDCIPGQTSGEEIGGGESTASGTPIEVPPLIDTLKGPLLTVVVEGPGTVTSNPTRRLGDRLLGLVCTTDSVCSLKFLLGTEVTLLARPDDDATFVGWGGQCRAGQVDGLITTSMTLDSSSVCRAVFESNEEEELDGLSTEGAEAAPTAGRPDPEGPVNGREPR